MAPIEIRPPSRVLRKIFQPSPRSPSICSAGMRQPSKSSSPVALAWRPIFSSSRPTLKPARPAGTMKALISGAPSSRLPVRAVTM